MTLEKLQSTMKGRNTDLHSDTGHRMQTRPPSYQAGRGEAFHDHGNSFGLPRSAPLKTYARSGGSTLKGKTVRAKTTSMKHSMLDSFSESDDELLLDENSSQIGDASPLRNTTSNTKGKAREKLGGEENKINCWGTLHDLHPDFPPKKLPNFTKTKRALGESSVPEAPPPSSSLPDTDSQDPFPPIADDLTLPPTPTKPQSQPRSLRRGGSARSTDAFNRPESRSTRVPRKQATISPSRSPKAAPSSTRSLAENGRATRSMSRMDQGFQHKDESSKLLPVQAPPRPRPKPRPLKAQNSMISRYGSPEATPRPQKYPVAISPPLQSGSKGITQELSSSRQTDEPAASHSRRTLQEFPMTPPAKKKNAKGKGKSKSPERGLPLPSPLADPGLRRELTRTGSAFPALSPISTPSRSEVPFKDKGKKRAVAHAQDGNDLSDVTITRPKPFPLSSQVLASIDRIPSSQARSPRLAKRASDDSDGGRGRVAKRRKDNAPGMLAYLDTDGIGYANEDSLELGPVADPSTLCPYCDDILPPHPTPLLKSLLATAQRKSYPDPRPRNPRGLKAPLPAYISACQRHRFETHHLPMAVEKGWPTEIDFKQVPRRVEGMKGTLEAIISDGGESGEGDEDDLYEHLFEEKGPRGRSVFWHDVKREVKKQGSRAALGVKGQFASFEKTQPGYYGELGSVIIHQTLYNLFPPSSFDASLIVPLTPAEFIQRILVPEAALELIMEDLCIDRDEALVTLRESAQYGVAMFPDTAISEGKVAGAEGEDEEMGVADQIVMERARVRRMELEQEERIEEEMFKEEESRRKAKEQEGRKAQAREQRAERARKREKLQTASEVETSEASEYEHPPRKGKQRSTRATPATDTEIETDVMSVDSTASKRPTWRARSRRARHGGEDGEEVASKTAISTNSDNGLAMEIASEKDNRARFRGHSRRVAPGAWDADIPNTSEAEVVEILSQPGPPSRKRSSPVEGMAESDSDLEIEVSSPRKAPLPNQGDNLDTATPRPLRPFPLDRPAPTRISEASTSESRFSGTSGALKGRQLPLLAAKSRNKAVIETKGDGWMSNMRDHISEDSDIPSNIDRSSRQNTRQTKRKNEHSWLLSQSSSDVSPPR
ncbi:hypothetical protein BV22DRAFT_1133001 [Leucogyrophana mollusca]|uniref:Uncharacterized protein n=1 Tax=Leucogyrophana mollusca TaxID=85980 RepID=A0ACB8B518_9AGAM|nr:hypothetical protein BV22DRAFT_1133001 [Leucogyrophana mollusca]